MYANSIQIVTTKDEKSDAWHYANERANYWLYEHNIADEQGKKLKAEKCYAKAQYWLDRLNRLDGLS